MHKRKAVFPFKDYTRGKKTRTSSNISTVDIKGDVMMGHFLIPLYIKMTGEIFLKLRKSMEQ